MAVTKRPHGDAWSKPVPAVDVLEFIETHVGVTTNELKNHFRTNSAEIRKACGKLMAHNKIFPTGMLRNAVAWMIVDGKRGAPNPLRARAAWAHDYKAGVELETDLDAVPELDAAPGKSRIRDPHGNESQIKTDSSRKVGKVIYARNPDEEG